MSAEEPERPTETKTTVVKRWRYFSRRHAILAGTILGIGAAVLILVVFFAFRLGFVDRYLAGQIKTTFANYGIRAEIRDFHATFPPQTVEMLGIELYDAQTGERLGKIDRLFATIRIEDLYALHLSRNINLQDLKIEGLETWVTFDKEGRTNFRNVHIPPPEPNRRILFAYSTAKIELTNGVIHYGDARHELSGEGRNLQATIQPDDPNAPAESWMNSVTFALSNSTFTYDGRPINNIDLQMHGRVNQTRAEIQDFVIKSPVAEARLQGTMDDWRALRYQMNVTSSVDLTQLSDTLQSKPALRGTGNFSGVVTGEGDRFKFEGGIKSDALAADNVRLQGLNLTASGTGQGKTYEINGKAVADLLNAGDFEIDSLQLVGKVMGNGANLRWVGELRAVAEKSYGTTLTGLILRDARAEVNEGVLTASSSQFSANGLNTGSAKVNGITANDLRVKNENNVTTATVKTVKAGSINASGAQVKGVTANDIEAVDRNGVTSVVVKQVQVGETSASGAQVGALNIAGVRLTIRNRRIEGSTSDIDAGTVKLADGQVEKVKLTKPVFVVEPSGSYRASADLSIGGGVMGRMNMGQARANLVATSREIQLNNFTADIFTGHASGAARIAITRGGTSQVVADFNNLDIAGPLTALANSAVPLSGRATGRVELSFPGTDFKLASGTLTTHLSADTTGTSTDRVPVTGEVAVRAERGQFAIQQLDLRTPASTLKATGQFSFENDSNLQVDLNSTDAAELFAVVMSAGLLPEDIESQLQSSGVELAGQLAFNGTIRGQLAAPDISGRVSLGSLVVNGNDVGSLSATLAMTVTDIRVTDGHLNERDGGGIQFSLNAPRNIDNGTSLQATLDRVNAATLVAVLPISKQQHESLADTRSDVSGQVNITGIPNAMSGSADLRFGPGRLAGEPLTSLQARATFTGASVKVESIDARLEAGRIAGSGNFDIKTKGFDLEGRAEGIQLARLAAFANKPNLPPVTGVGDFSLKVSGNYGAKDFSALQVSFNGQARDVTINGHSAGTLKLVGETANQQLNATVTTSLLGSPQVITAQVNLAGERLPAVIQTTLNNADLSNLFAIGLPQSGVKVGGHVTGSLKATGDLFDEDDQFSIAGLSGAADLSELSFDVQDVKLTAQTPLSVRFTPTEVSLERVRFTGPGTNITLDGTLATASGGPQNLNVNGNLDLRFLNGLSPDFFSSGAADVAIRISGTFEQPRVIGTASVANGSASALLGNERWTVNNLKALVRFSANQAQIDSLTGTLGGGRVTASGGALLEGFTVAAFRLNLHAEDVTVSFPEDFRSTLDAEVEIRGSSREQLIGGVVNLRRTEYTQDIELADLINNRRGESIEEGAEIALVRTAVFAGLRVEGRNALVVRNNLADVVGSVSLQLNGPVNDPTISGRVTATSGTLNFRNDRYDVTRAFVDLPPNRNADPIINFQGETTIRGYRVIAGLTGPLSNPQATVRSDPALPQADVVSLITTGQLSSADTSSSILSQSAVGTATSLLTDALINAPASRATNKLFGLTRFEINPVIGGRTGSAPAARLTLGRRISKEVTVTYSTNVTSDPNQILALEYRVSDRLSFLAQYEQASSRTLTPHTNNFNFEIRFRKRF